MTVSAFARTTVSLVLAIGFAAKTAMANPDEASAATVSKCHFLGTVAGNSGYCKNMGWKPLAKASAEIKAGKLGATHIVFTHYRPVGSFNGEAEGKAYSCNP